MEGFDDFVLALVDGCCLAVDRPQDNNSCCRTFVCRYAAYLIASAADCHIYHRTADNYVDDDADFDVDCDGGNCLQIDADCDDVEDNIYAVVADE